MVSFLSTIIDNFPGAMNHTHCFAHTVNIVAKAILKQFDVPKAPASDSGTLDDCSALQDLSEDLDTEDQSTLEAWEAADDDDEEDRPLNTWDNYHEGLSNEQLEQLDIRTQPVRSMLVKVCLSYLESFSHSHINNTSHSCVILPLRSRTLQQSSSHIGLAILPVAASTVA